MPSERRDEFAGNTIPELDGFVKEALASQCPSGEK
jgi:hypothetical protein